MTILESYIIDEVNDTLWKRKIQLRSLTIHKFFNTINIPLMTYAIEYIKTMKFAPTILYHLNFMQIKKEIYLPCELISFKINIKISYYSDIREKSPIRWNISKFIYTLITSTKEQI